MNLRAKLEKRKNVPHYENELAFKQASDTVEECFLLAKSECIRPGCRVMVRYRENEVGYKNWKQLLIQFFKNEDINSAILVNPYSAVNVDDIESISWEEIKKWANWFCIKEDLEFEIIDDTFCTLAIIYN